MLKAVAALLPIAFVLTACQPAEGVFEPPGDNEVYVDAPELATCKAGVLQDEQAIAALDSINQIRARHGLQPVTWDASGNDEVAQAALIMAANNKITHSPATDAKCYSSTGLTGAQESLLYIEGGSNTLEIPPSRVMEAFLVDKDVSNLGHRRWLLDPFLGKTTFGRADGPVSGGTGEVMAAALRVIGSPDATLGDDAPDFIAYPDGDYPARLVDKSWYLSFSVLQDKTSRSNNNADDIDFSDSIVEVRTSGGTALAVSEISYDYNGYGLPNSLQWRVSGLQDNQVYNVTVRNVRMGTTLRNYNYSFRLLP